ncbi:hypothetical protein quinque_002308 [Culex quinquefasciatus]
MEEYSRGKTTADKSTGRKPKLDSRQKRSLKRIRNRWCKAHKDWRIAQWKKVVYSDESTFTLFPTTGRVYVWRKEAYDLDCLKPTVKHGGGSVMVWGAISWYGVGPITAVKGTMKADHYREVLENQV